MKGNRPSITAIKVARDFVFFTRNPAVGRLVSPDLPAAIEAILESAGYLPGWMKKMMESRAFQRFGAWAGNRMIAGSQYHLSLRKRFMDDAVKGAIADGATQVLVLGAGFDGLCTRIAGSHPEVLCVEIDHPSTHRVKKKALEDMGPLAGNLRLVAADLGERPLDEVLRGIPEWRTDAVTAVVAEGLLMYLDESDVIRLFDMVRSSTSPGSRVAFSFIPADEGGRQPLGGYVRFWLRVVGEPWKWAVHAPALAPLLAERGFDLIRQPSPDDLRREYMEPVGLGDQTPPGMELMGVAESTDRPSSANL